MKMIKFNEIGRSMVEMLGVLAIIGVLSVGAIAGYSKAMMKYKLNKQAQQLSQVINSITQFHNSFSNLTNTTKLFPYLIKMGEIPKEMIKQDYQESIYDVFNTSLTSQIQPITSTNEGEIKGVTALYIGLDLSKKSNQNFEICKNIYTIIKENSSNIYYTYSGSGHGTDDQRNEYYHGDRYCDGYKSDHCIKDLTVEKIYQTCTLHVGSTTKGHIVILWK